MIRIAGNVYLLSTPGSSYLFQVLETGHLEHLVYGPAICREDQTDAQILQDARALSQKRVFPFGNSISYDPDHPELTLEDSSLEMSSYGKGDIREPFVDLIHADGGRTCDFLFEEARLCRDEEKGDYKTLPGSAGSCDHLTLTLKDKNYDLTLELHYFVFEDCDVICRSSRLINTSKSPVRLERLMSTQLDLPGRDYIFSNFTGAWAREMDRCDTPVHAGKMVNASFTGSSSSRCNPFVMLSKEETTEEAGPCWGLNLIYSGNHYEALEAGSMGRTRFVSGINPQGMSFLLAPGEDFEAPEAVMTYSGHGFSGMSLSMHRFVREHIVRGEWKKKLRPVLINSWEAAYFKFDEKKLLKLARTAKDVGIELFVLDDGWFGKRDSDNCSLGDWTANKKKLPGGLKGLSDKIHALGLDFGIWLEPEMVNVDSDLYRAHPEWTMDIPGMPHSEGRNQRILDLADPTVVDHMTDVMRSVLSGADIDYVKWDMNRIFSDVYSRYLPAQRQGETAHRYILGLYRMLKTLTQEYPHILFEGCASGGNRFDLGMLCYFPQIWASDDTDPMQRAHIQEGYSFGYPMSVLTSHISASPNHQTLRKSPLDTRFAVAAFGILGYELNLCDPGKKELGEIKRQICLYKKWRSLLQTGIFYRGRTGNIHEWTCVSPDKKRAVGMILQELAGPNQPYERFHARGLDRKKRYHLYNIEIKRDIREFGGLVNTASPVHVRPGGALHTALAHFVSMPGEVEDVRAGGALLMDAGISLLPAYAGTGYNEKTRYFADFSARIYFMEEENSSSEETS